MIAFQRAVAARFSENLVRARERTGVSQEELGYRSSLHRTQVSILERGRRLPRLDTILKLAGSLSISPCELLQGITWVPGDFKPGAFELSDGESRDQQDKQVDMPEGWSASGFDDT